MPPDLVLANPGHIPWMQHTARAAADVGRLRAYCAPAAYAPSEISSLSERIPGVVADRIAGELRRRQVPEALRDRIRRIGSFGEAASVGLRRVGAPRRVTASVADARDRSFDRGVARLLRASDTAVFVAYHASLRTIEAADRLGVRSLLDYPVSHHRFIERELGTELRLKPEYASTMQFHEPSARRIARMDAELARVDVVTALSGFHAGTFVDAGVNAEKVRVVPFGVDSDVFSPSPKPSLRDRFRVVFVGQLTQRKGLSYAVDGFRKAGLADAELLLVGQPVGDEAPWARTPGVRHLPMVAPGEMPDIYRSADVVVLPSLVEGLARVLLEAMASAVPVIATPHTGAEEVMEDGVSGFIVPPRDEDAIADRLRQLRGSSSMRASMGARARHVAEGYPWSRYAQTMLEIASE